MFRGGLGQQAVASAVLASLGLAWLLVGAAIDATAAFMAVRLGATSISLEPR